MMGKVKSRSKKDSNAEKSLNLELETVTEDLEIYELGVQDKMIHVFKALIGHLGCARHCARLEIWWRR